MKTDVKLIFQNVGIDTKRMVSYKQLYNTTPYTFTYRGCSMWLYTYDPDRNKIEVNKTYIEETKQIKEFNKTN